MTETVIQLKSTVEPIENNKVTITSDPFTITTKDGEKGDTGPRGLQGPKGDPGPTGRQGEQGLTGKIGPQGSPGAKGDKGDPGKDGIMTFTDLTPSQKASLKGDTGSQGRTGDRGPKGDPGPKGDTGDRGSQGERGIQGPAGKDGSSDSTSTVDQTARDKAEEANRNANIADTKATHAETIANGLSDMSADFTAFNIMLSNGSKGYIVKDPITNGRQVGDILTFVTSADNKSLMLAGNMDPFKSFKETVSANPGQQGDILPHKIPIGLGLLSANGGNNSILIFDTILGNLSKQFVINAGQTRKIKSLDGTITISVKTDSVTISDTANSFFVTTNTIFRTNEKGNNCVLLITETNGTAALNMVFMNGYLNGYISCDKENTKIVSVYLFGHIDGELTA